MVEPAQRRKHQQHAIVLSGNPDRLLLREIGQTMGKREDEHPLDPMGGIGIRTGLHAVRTHAAGTRSASKISSAHAIRSVLQHFREILPLVDATLFEFCLVVETCARLGIHFPT